MLEGLDRRGPGVAGVRWTGLGLLGSTAARVLLVDMASLEGLTRIYGSTVVWLILLGAGVGYAWLMGRENLGTPEPDTESDTL